MREDRTIKGIIAVLLLLVALVSFTAVGKVASNPQMYHHTIAALDQKEQNVLKLTAGATATSVLITLIPDDIATPLADKLADVAGYLLIVICAVYAEKYLLTITGFAVFKILIPAACLIGIYCIFRKNDWGKQLAIKLSIFALLLVAIIPVSIRTSEMVEGVYAESIEATMEEAEHAQEQVGSKDAILEKAKAIINNYVQAVAVFIVTSCVIPIVVLLFFSWVMRIFFGVTIPMPKARKRGRPAAEA